MPSPPSIQPLDHITLNNLTIDLSSPPRGLQHRPDLGLLLHERMHAQRLHAWPAPEHAVFHPRAIKTPGGDYLALMVAGEGHYGALADNQQRKPNRMIAYRSRDRGNTWHGPLEPWSVPYSQHAAIPFIPRNSQRLYVFGTEPRPDWLAWELATAQGQHLPHKAAIHENAVIGMRYSDDDGLTWSDVAPIRPLNAPDYMGISAMRMCETASGAWLIGTHAGREPGSNKQNSAPDTRQYILRSEDQGASWSLLPSLESWHLPFASPEPGYARLEEGRPVHLGEDHVLLLERTCAGHLWQQRSNDGGLTWTLPEPTMLVHPDAPPMLFHLADNTTLIALHHNNPGGGHFNFRARGELWFSLSHDAGLSWSEPRFLLANAAQPDGIWHTTSVSYNDLLVDGENLHLFVEFQVRQILHVHFTLSELVSCPTREELAGQPAG